jgi:hypothetical protein
MSHDSSSSSAAWLHAIVEATACLRSKNEHEELDDDIEEGLQALTCLELFLLACEAQWDHPPTMLPPPRSGDVNDEDRAVAVAHQLNTMSLQSPLLGGNRFASIQYDDSDDEEKMEEEDDGGDIPTLNRTPLPTEQKGISMRRLMIRVVTAQSELYAKLASACRRYPEPRWVQGADTYETSLVRIRYALDLADSEISRLFDTNISARGLVEDASIVVVAVEYLTKERAAFQNAAEHKQQYLLKKLNPQWAKRDAIKSRLGDKWTNNPSPRNDYRRLREEDELQLREVQAALEKLLAMDTDQAQEHAEELRCRLQQQQGGGGQRNNGVRPIDTADRVSWERRS